MSLSLKGHGNACAAAMFFIIHFRRGVSQKASINDLPKASSACPLHYGSMRDLFVQFVQMDA